jgi:excinuclease ABC subunit A
MAGNIVIKGARVHNLKNIDLEIPRDRLVVITGVSGSGKSSLAFDTLYAEGQRRYLESLAADARQLLQQMERPDVDSIEGLSPAIAIQQKAAITTPRSTVGTVTEIYDYLRLLFARVGKPTCVQCGRDIRAWTIEEIVDQILSLPAGTRILVMAPIALANKADYHERLKELAREGFARVKIDGEIKELPEAIDLDQTQPHQIDLVVDRLNVREGVEKRLADSLEIASRFGDQIIKVEIQEGGVGEPQEMAFSQKLACVQCGIALAEITPRSFSFNSPEGACPACGGLGMKAKPGRNAKTAEQAAEASLCETCNGSRLKRESLAIKLGGKSIAEVTALSVTEALDFFGQLELGVKERMVGQKVVDEIVSRLRFLLEVGLDYLTLDRPSITLSGGEAQRVRLATQIGSHLAGVLYILDEPSIGLHQKDTARLLSLLKKLRDANNTVIVVEHDRETIVAADHVIDMGPGAGIHGGEVVAQGTPEELLTHDRSLTGRYLSGRMSVGFSPQRRKGTGECLIITGAREQNLKNITAKIPIGAMTCVTGVSGAGKSTLVMDVLFLAVTKRLQRSPLKGETFDELTGWEQFDRVIGVDQGPIGRTPRSNPATYTGLYDYIRELFAQLPEARMRGYPAERFSFNLSGGRCEACRGDGVVRVDMYFLPDVYVTCDVCKGRRYNRETLEIKYKGLSIADVLDLTVSRALEIFSHIPRVYERLATLHEVGLGYLQLGQPASTLSGGESQRVKLARELARRSTGTTLYMMDEPTTGLHFDDVKKLLDLLHRLTDAGNTFAIIEHNLDVIKNADYIIDLGPEGGDKGGQVVATGTPEEIANSNSATGEYLKQVLA